MWNFKLKGVQDYRLVQFNFKFLYNILPTPQNLHRWKIKDNSICTACDVEGTLFHVYFYCRKIEGFLKYIERLLRKVTGETFNLNYEYFVYGYNLKTDNGLIDLLLNYALFAIFKVWMLKDPSQMVLRDFVEHFIRLIRNRYEIEQKKKKQKMFVKLEKWKEIEYYL